MGRDFRRSCFIGGLTALLAVNPAPIPAQSTPALPHGGAFVAGVGAIGGVTGNSLSITQSSARGVIDWTSFSIGAGGRVFINNGAGATLSRVTGGNLSRIDGFLKATGSLYLINANGLVIGPNGRVFAGGSFTGSTRNIATSDFMAGGALRASGSSSGDLINRGSIVAREGDVVLIGRSVENTGSISAPAGTATLASGDNVLLSTVGGPAGVYVAPSADNSGSLTETGRIQAAAAALKAAGGDIYTLAGNRSGLISATGSKTIDGEVWLSAPNGTVMAGGEISAQNADGAGGRVVVNGANVTVDGGARISAQGSSGGTVLIGVSTPGGKDLAGSTVVSSGASILAGGTAGGGLVETSGRSVSVGKATIAAGQGGLWRVDPVNLTIDSAAASTIDSSLNSGTNVSEQTTSTSASGAGTQSAGAGDITVAAPLSWTGSGALSLSAYHDLNLNAAISGAGAFTGVAGGAIAVGANVSASNVLMTASGGDLTLNSGVNVAGATGVTLQTTGQFMNHAGPGALSPGTGRWLVYSTDPSTDTTGGLSPSFYQYAATSGTTPAASGNGLLYSVTPNLSVALSGTVEKTYDGTTAASFTAANSTVSGLINSDAATVIGSYASKDAANGITVTASDITVTHSGVPVYGYGGTTPSASAPIGKIDPATLTASIVGDPTKTYNGTTTATLTPANYQLNGFAPGEGATVNQPSTVAYDSSEAGARTVSATFSPTNFAAAGGTNLSNYTVPTSATGPGYINPAPLLITGVLATDKVYDRTAADTLNTGAAALYGVIGSDNVNLVTSGATGAFSTANVGSALPVTASGFTVSGAKAPDYALVQPTGLSANIAPASLTIGGVAAISKVYDATGTAALSTSGATLNGVISGDTVTLGSGSATGTFATSDVGTGIAVSASGFTVSGAPASNYVLTQPTGLLADITPKSLAAAIISTPTKTYNGDAVAAVDSSGFSLTGFVGGQSATIGQTSNIAYATPNAGTQTVTATLGVSDYVAGSGAKLSNYLLPTTATGTGVINPAPIAIEIYGNPTKTYDGTASAALNTSNYQLSGFLAGQSATVNQTAGVYDSANAGVRQVTATLSGADFTPGSGTILSNYAFPATVSGFGTIIPAPISGGITAAITGNPTKTYDGGTVASLTSSNFQLSGFAAGQGATVTQTVGQYASKNVGVQPVTANLSNPDFTPDSGTNLSNYTLPTVAYGSGTINPAVLTASVIGTPTKVYNGTTNAALLPANFGISGLAPGEGVNIGSAIPAVYDSSQAGSRAVTATIGVTDITAQSGTLLSNYVLPTSATGAGTITQAPLSILGVSAQDKTYDTTAVAALSTGGAHLFGVVGQDNVTLSTSGATGVFATANAGSGISVAASGFSISGSAAANYQMFQPSGLTANILRAPLSITGVSALNKNYDNTNADALSTGSAALSGVLSPDAGQVALSTSGTTAVFSSVNVGNHLAVNTGGFSLTGAQASNYALNQPSGLTASIMPQPLTALIVGNPTKVYDGSSSTTLTAANYQLVGFVAGQGATVPQSATAQYLSPDAGSQGIGSTLASSDFRANAGTNLSNYALPTTGSGTGTITQARLTAAIIGNPSKTYDTTTGATLTSSNYALSGFVSGQGATVSQTAGAYDAPHAGASTVTAALSAGEFTGTGATNLNNYALPSAASGAGTINQAPLQVVNVSGTNRAYNGGYADTLNVSSAGLSGVLGSDTVNLNTGSAAGVFASKDAGSGIGVTASGFTISGGQSADYTLAQPTGLFGNITQALLNLTNVTRVYDSTTGLPSVSSAYALSGLFGSDAVSVNTSGISGSYADKNVGTGKSVTLSGLALTGAQAGDYSIASSLSNASIGTITKAPLTVTGAVALNKVYDATTDASLDNSSAALSGLFAGDAVTLDTAGATGLFGDKNVGTGKAVTASGYTVSGVDFGNYSFTQPTGLSANITPYTNISLTSVTKTYDGGATLPTASTAYTLGGLLGSDSVQVNTGGLSGGYVSANARSNLTVNLSGLALMGTDAANYAIGSTVSNANIGFINSKALTAGIVGTPTKIYDATTAAVLGSSNYSLSGFVSGEGATVKKTSGAYASANAGTPGVSTSLASGDFTPNAGTLLTNYLLPISASGAGQINRAPLTITGVLATSKAYDGSVADPLNKASAALAGVVGSDTGLVTLNSGSAAGAFASPNVGTGIAVTASGFAIAGSKSGNYTLAQPIGLSADIAQAVLNLASVTKEYDATNSAVGTGVSYALSGVMGTDSVSLNTSGLAGAYGAKNVGTGIGVSLTGLALTGAQAANYSIASSVTGAFIGTITQAPLTVTGAVAAGKVYNGTAAAVIDNGHAGLSGVLGSDAVNLSSPTTGTFASANAGTWAVTPGGAYAVSGADAGNYMLTQPTGFSATITPAPLLAAITGNPSKIYDAGTVAALAPGNYTLSGFVAGQGASVTQTAGTYDAADAGARIVTASLGGGYLTPNSGTNFANYILPSTASGAGTINPKTLSAAIVGNPARIYDGTTAAVLSSGNYALTGFIAGQGASVTQTTGTYDVADAGTRTVTASLGMGDFTASSGTNLANYALPATASGAGMIDPRMLTAAITGDPTRPYDGTAAAALASGDYTLNGFVAGQGAAVTQAVGIYDAADAGSRTVTAALSAGFFTANGGTNLTNYILPTTASGVGTIDPKTVTAAITGTFVKTYDGATAVSLISGNYTLDGFVAGQGATVTQTAGNYDAADAGARTITAQLGAGYFTAGAGTNLGNYALPAIASGIGTIDPKVLSAAITGNPTKAYDGGTAAVLGAGDYTLTGFLAGQNATITQTAGVYSGQDAGAWNVSARLPAGDFTAATGTSLSNYVLPASASGAGTISPKALSATITGASKTYDGSTSSTLGVGNFVLTGFAAGQGATVIQTTGVYAAADAGAQGVSAPLSAGNFILTAATNASNYILPTIASGMGLINPRPLMAAITGTPTKSYDGTIAAVLVPGNYTLSGFIAGQGATVTQSAGAYDTADAGTRTVTAALGAGYVTANGETNLANYLLPATASGAGTIDPRTLTAAIIGVPSKMNDGTILATLSPGNFALTGFVAGQGAAVTQTTGGYDSADTGSRLVTAILGRQSFSPNTGTLLSNYLLPVSASGAGIITPAILTNAPTLADAIISNMTVRNLASATQIVTSATRAVLGAAVPRIYIPYPAPSTLSTWQNNGFGSLPTIVNATGASTGISDAGDRAITSGPPVINTTEQILLQGGKDKSWRIALPPANPPAVSTGAAR